MMKSAVKMIKKAAADCFRDGIITEADAKILAKYILGECAALPYIC